LAHLAWTPPLRRAQAGLSELRDQKAVPVGGKRVNQKHPTSNIQHPTPKSPDAGGRTLDVERSMLDVGCSTWLLLNSGPCPPAFNMALDEALLESMSRLGRPVLRFYGWTEPAATFGYFQKYADVERATHLRPLIRRPTGGGIVPHDADWTYSLVFPPGHEWHSLKAEESYLRVHEWIQSAFAKLNVPTKLAPCSKKSTETVRRSRREEAYAEKLEISQSLLTSSPTGQCFAGYEKFDVLWHEKKIAGAAQRRNKLGLLIQGSVQSRCIGISLSPPDWQKAMCYVGRIEFGAEWSDFAPDETLRERAEFLAKRKYSQPAFIRKR
jgi:lipoate-protein ligase A